MAHGGWRTGYLGCSVARAGPKPRGAAGISAAHRENSGTVIRQPHSASARRGASRISRPAVMSQPSAAGNEGSQSRGARAQTERSPAGMKSGHWHAAVLARRYKRGVDSVNTTFGRTNPPSPALPGPQEA